MYICWFAAGFSLTHMVALTACGSLLLVGAGAAVAWKVVKRRTSLGKGEPLRRKGGEEEEQEEATGRKATGNDSHRKPPTPTSKPRRGDRVIAGSELKRDWGQRWDSRPALWLAWDAGHLGPTPSSAPECLCDPGQVRTPLCASVSQL
ncbi:unnamed protein product [Natator depressus]